MKKDLWYKGITMKEILESKGYYNWSYSNTDTSEIFEAPDANWLKNIIFELKDIQKFSDKEIKSLLEEYFEERKKYIVDEWRELSEIYLNNSNDE